MPQTWLPVWGQWGARAVHGGWEADVLGSKSGHARLPGAVCCFISRCVPYDTLRVALAPAVARGLLRQNSRHTQKTHTTHVPLSHDSEVSTTG